MLFSKIVSYARALGGLPNFKGLLGSTFALGVAFSFVAPFMSKWGTEEVGMSPTQFSLYMTAISLSAIVVSTMLARLSDYRFSRRQMLILGSLGGMLGFVAYALIRDIVVLLIVGCSLHAVASICFAQLFSHVREVYQNTGDNPGSSRISTSVVRVCFSFSWTLGPAVGSFALIAFGFRGLFLAAACLYLIFLLGVLKFIPEKKRPKKIITETTDSIWVTLRQPRLAICFIAFVAFFAAHAINMLNLPLAITRTFGGSESDFGIIFGIGPLVEIPLMLWFGHLAGKGYQLSLIRIGFASSLLYFIGLSLASSPWHVYILQLLSGTAFAILTNIAILFFQDMLPKQLGLATSLFSNASAVGNLLGMLSFGFLVEATGHQHTFIACSIVSALGLVIILRIRQEATHTQDSQ